MNELTNYYIGSMSYTNTHNKLYEGVEPEQW